MSDHRRRRVLFFRRLLTAYSLTIVGLSLATPATGTAQQLQPLAEFLDHTSAHNPDTREARATAAQRAHEASQAWARLYPTATIQAGATANQYLGAVDIPVGQPGTAGATTRHVVITPTDQRDGTLTLAVPLVDVSAWRGISAAVATRDAQDARLRATDLTVQATIARTYYQLLAAAAVGRAARRTLGAAEDNVHFVETRVRAGLAADLDLKRAQAEFERDRQAIEDADYTIVSLRRSLESASGLAPAGDPLVGTPTLPSDDLHDELPLASWMSLVDGLPSVTAARADADAGRRNAGVTRAASLPTVSLQFTEHATNATGFGRSPSYALQVVGTWKLDPGSRESAHAQAYAAEAATVRADRARTAAADAVFDAWQQVRTQIAKCRAARSSLAASSAAISLAASSAALAVARERFGSGKALSLDVIQAERDAYAAEVTAIQAEADLASARANLRLSAGGAPESR